MLSYKFVAYNGLGGKGGGWLESSNIGGSGWLGSGGGSGGGGGGGKEKDETVKDDEDDDFNDKPVLSVSSVDSWNVVWQEDEIDDEDKASSYNSADDLASFKLISNCFFLPKRLFLIRLEKLSLLSFFLFFYISKRKEF